MIFKFYQLNFRAQPDRRRREKLEAATGSEWSIRLSNLSAVDSAHAANLSNGGRREAVLQVEALGAQLV